LFYSPTGADWAGVSSTPLAVPILPSVRGQRKLISSGQQESGFQKWVPGFKFEARSWDALRI
jgi:hypothetical protein